MHCIASTALQRGEFCRCRMPLSYNPEVVHVQLKVIAWILYEHPSSAFNS